MVTNTETQEQEENKEVYLIDLVPKFKTQRRSPPSKPRSDFSFLISESNLVKCTSSTSTQCKNVNKRKFETKQKDKICSDEGASAQTCGRKVRQLRIMRSLGLIAPIGSPFSRVHNHEDADAMI
ncbi:uncharacterized protein LOC126676393 [Mercurialis annua]|uniref:uncharacterized protein LOC126676393 n=1 Tax=Mercurialis annua TaxID=3986 RepID=UPI00215DEEC4|nr:uncharacterized protein LOC126676393 [Mercurialis annua]